MWRGVRCTVRRATLRARIWARALTARRWRRSFLVMFIGCVAALLLLAFFEGDLLILVAHALALVGLGRPDVADFGRGLTDLLPVRAFDHDLGEARRLDADAFRNRIGHRVRETERQVQYLAGHLGAKADADQLELALIALGHAQDHVRQVRAHRAGGHARLAGALVFHRQ